MTITIQNKPARRRPRSGQKDLQESFNSLVADTFDRKALFDLISVSGGPSTIKTSHVPADHFEKHLYFVTFHVRRNSYSARDDFSTYDAQPIFAAFKSWYLSMCRNLLGPRFNKRTNLKLQPFALAFLDVEGSRHGNAAKAFEIPHIHALMLLHPKVAEDFKRLTKSARLTCSDDPRIGKIDIEPFKDDGRGTRPLMTYAAKYPRLVINSSRQEVPWLPYPDLQPEKYAFLRADSVPQEHASAL